MAEDKAKKAAEPGICKGVITDLKKVGENLEGTVTTAEGKAHRVVAYLPRNQNAADAMTKAAETGAPMIFGGAMLGRGDSFHFGVSFVKDPAPPKAEKPAAEGTAPKAEKVALTDQEKKDLLDLRDATRVPVLKDSVAAGGTVKVGDKDVTVTAVGKSWALDDDGAADINARFEGANFKAGDEIAYAKFEEPEVAEEPLPSP